MRQLFLVAFVSLCIVFDNILYVYGADCVYTVGDFTLDLSSLSSETLSYTDDSGSTTFVYTYTPCRDGSDCVSDDLGEGKYMATQTGNKCNYLASWNATVQPKYSDNAYTLTYRNGQDGRSFAAKYKCGSSSYSVNKVSEDSLLYTMEIESSYACGGNSPSSGNDELSLGWILIIVVVSCLFLYCLIGYIICAKKNPDNGWGNVKANTPHLSFWCMLPKLTWAGCCVTKDFIVNSFNKVRGKGGDGAYEGVDDA